MSGIVTFYSYKGGVGRSMALANIAFELARRNKKVLMVDWDLEAPGLERYFINFEVTKQGEGLLPLLQEFQNNNSADYNNYLWTIHTQFAHPVYLLHSGREKNPVKYSLELENFDWEEFFKKGGGLHLENLRNSWLNDFDLVLIDSRTGLSDSSGICTILLPDIVIPMFTANYQSLFGIRDIMSYIQSARQKLSVDRMCLTILPVPSRFGTRVEFKESQEWLDRIADILKDCFSDWLPKWIEPRYILEQTKIPQVDYFSFGEKLAVAEQGTNDPESMGFIYSKLADFLASDFIDIETFVGKSYYEERKADYEKKNPKQHIGSKKESKYTYDLFISAPRSAYQWVNTVLSPALIEYLTDELAVPPTVFLDTTEIKSGENWDSAVKSAIEKSKVFLFVFSDLETNSEYLSNELIFADALQHTTTTNILFPVYFKKIIEDLSKLPTSVINKKIVDLSAFTAEAINSSTKISAQFGNTIDQLSSEIANSIKTINNADDTPEINKKNVYTEIEALAYAYENIRKQMTPGNNRTRSMQDIVDKMHAHAPVIHGHLPELINSQSPGKRLAAIVALQSKPDIHYIDWLAEHVGDVEKPFIGYQASVGLYNASGSLGKDFTYDVLKAIDRAIENINKSEYRDPNQVSVLESAKAELSYKNIIKTTPETVVNLEKVFADDTFKTYKWYMIGADRCLAVARIGKNATQGFGTGFIMRGDSLHKSLRDEIILVTAAHVISNDPSVKALKPEEAIVTFEALTSFEEFRQLEIIWTSSSRILDTTIIRFGPEDQQRLKNLTRNIKFYPISKYLPVVEDPASQKIYIIGHPNGGTMQMSFQDNLLLDHEAPKFHYRTPTEGGSAGSPVFNQDWDLIGMHHASSDNMPRLNGKQGRYEANEGIWIQSIIKAFGQYMESEK